VNKVVQGADGQNKRGPKKVGQIKRTSGLGRQVLGKGSEVSGPF
jgi:hypothetical protein